MNDTAFPSGTRVRLVRPQKYRTPYRPQGLTPLSPAKVGAEGTVIGDPDQQGDLFVRWDASPSGVLTAWSAHTDPACLEAIEPEPEPEPDPTISYWRDLLTYAKTIIEEQGLPARAENVIDLAIAIDESTR